MATHKTSQLPTTRKVSKSGYSKVHLPPSLNIFETGILKPVHLQFPWQHFFVDNTAKLTMPSTIAGFLDTTNDIYCASLLCMATTRQGSAQNNRKALPRQAPWQAVSCTSQEHALFPRSCELLEKSAHVTSIYNFISELTENFYKGYRYLNQQLPDSSNQAAGRIITGLSSSTKSNSYFVTSILKPNKLNKNQTDDLT